MSSLSLDAIFFDFDGVLVDSAPIKAAAFRRLYAPHGVEVAERVMAYHKANEGISRLVKIRHCHREFLGIGLDDDALATVADQYSQEVESRVVECPWVAGAEAFVATHADATRLFVVSGTPEEELRRIAEARGMSRYFVELRGSPASKQAILDDLVARHGIDPRRALFVGDAMADLAAARHAGIDFLGRVAAGAASPFPPGTPAVADLSDLARRLALPPPA